MKNCIFSLEMSGEQLVTRILSSEALIDSYSLRSGQLKPEDWDNIAGVITTLSGCEIYVDDTSAITAYVAVDNAYWDSQYMLTLVNEELDLPELKGWGQTFTITADTVVEDDTFATWFTENTEPVALTVKEKIKILIAKANFATGNSDTDLTSGVNALIEGYGQGGEAVPEWNEDYTLSDDTEEITGREPILQEKTATANGVIVADSGYDGLSKVTVNVESTGGEDSPLPILVTTEAKMDALLKTAEVGSVYKYIGVTGTYETNALYVVEAVSE